MSRLLQTAWRGSGFRGTLVRFAILAAWTNDANTITVNGVNAANPEGTADPLPGTVDTVAALPLLNTDTSGTGASVQLDSLTWNPDPAGGGLWAFSLTVSNGDYEAQSKTITVRTVNNW